MLRSTSVVLGLLVLPAPVQAQVEPLPSAFHTQEIPTPGATLHVRVGGRGPAVLLLHGYGETGDMWTALAVNLVRDHTVVIPDLRGLGLSSRPAGGYDKKTQAVDMAAVLDALKIDRVDLITHDIGNMVGYAFAAQYPGRVSRFVLMDAPLPGVGPWDELVKSRALWHFNFGGPDAERLVAGRERIYLDRFWNEFSADPKRFSEASRAHYAKLYALPGAMHSGFAQFAAFDQDVRDNQAFLARGKLAMPVLAIGGQQSFGPTMAVVMRAVAVDVHELVIPDSGHWLMEEQPAATVKAVRAFLDQGDPARRMTPEDISKLAKLEAGAGTSGTPGIQTTVLFGDPRSPGLYTLRLTIAANTRIPAHFHQDTRTATVVSGVFYFGYGAHVDEAATKALPAGSFYTEPAGVMHFASTRAEPVVLDVTGFGPSSTTFVGASPDSPRP
jgi:pimeloyl-ACP methyl ester carboxylesterase/quercetin dioxygenase-like cupin family protein